MSYKTLKWLILTIPTLTIGLWEYVRHRFLLPYISMEMGNWLAPVFVFAVTITLLRKLFSMMEHMQDELHRERALKAALEERERIANELHDGVAQSLFLLSVQVGALEKEGFRDKSAEEQYSRLKETVRRVNEYVRQAIANLRRPPSSDVLPWKHSIERLIEDFRADTGIPVDVQWELHEEWSAKAKVELYACIREALLNIQKHADARHVWVYGLESDDGWICRIADDGKGFEGDPFRFKDRFGLKLMKERAEKMGWELEVQRRDGRTSVSIRGGKTV